MGINKEHLVSHSHSNLWSMTIDDITKGDTPFIPYTPWSSVETGDPNLPMMTGLFYGIYNYIIGNPGVTMVMCRSNHTIVCWVVHSKSV